jgi:DMSO/TMAO reductase YedYZ molybdopterin-dependent catalytic subunit
VLRANERVAQAYFRDAHRSPTFDLSRVDPETRKNGDIGLGEDLDPDRWTLTVQGPDATNVTGVTMSELRELPRIEQITQLNCIEGWTVVVQWAGVRFSDFTAKYARQFHQAGYIGMQTPDEKYFVGLDAASAMHPQTLLCYEMNGAPLNRAHGAPLRLVIPVKYGVKNIKRIGWISYSKDRPADYWANEGYDWYAGL